MTFAKKLLFWFRGNRRELPWRTETDPYKVLVAEKMLQQTDVGHVMKVYGSFLEKYPDVYALASAPEDEIGLGIRPLGFWRIRARDFKRMAQWIVTNHQGRVPSSLGELSELPGVGRYVSTAISCFCFGKRQAIVDVNVRRVSRRIFFWGKELPNDTRLELFMEGVMRRTNAKDFNWALLDFSATVCASRPRCNECFANDLCEYYQQTKN